MKHKKALEALRIFLVAAGVPPQLDLTLLSFILENIFAKFIRKGVRVQLLTTSSQLGLFACNCCAHNLLINNKKEH